MITIYDPAIPGIDLFNMGMICSVETNDNDTVHTDMVFSGLVTW